MSILFSSCSLTLPRFSKQSVSTTIAVSNNAAQIEALKKDDYTVLRKTTGKASTKRFYILFIPVGKHKSNSELFDNAYYNAIENIPNADALILPRQKIKKSIIPLILLNISKRTTTVSGLGISVNDKALENIESAIPYTIANNYALTEKTEINDLKSHKITTQNEFDKYFELKTSTLVDQTKKIDFSREYAIVVSEKASKKHIEYDVNYLKIKGSKINFSYNIEKSEKRKKTQQSFLIIVLNKKYQGDIRVK